jgi:hypothetical protein
MPSRHRGKGDAAMTRPDRLGKKTVSATVTVAQWKKLRHVVTETERTASDLISEAIDHLAEKYAPKKPATPLTSPQHRRSPG